MNIHDINKPVTSKTLNETMAKKYGTKIKYNKWKRLLQSRKT